MTLPRFTLRDLLLVFGLFLIVGLVTGDDDTGLAVVGRYAIATAAAETAEGTYQHVTVRCDTKTGQCWARYNDTGTWHDMGSPSEAAEVGRYTVAAYGASQPTITVFVVTVCDTKTGVSWHRDARRVRDWKRIPSPFEK